MNRYVVFDFKEQKKVPAGFLTVTTMIELVFQF